MRTAIVPYHLKEKGLKYWLISISRYLYPLFADEVNLSDSISKI